MSNFTFLLLELILADQVARSTPLVQASSGQECIVADQVVDLLADLPPSSDILVVKNGNFIFLLLELIVADLLADLPPQ